MESILADKPSQDISDFDSAFAVYGEKGPNGTALRKDGFRGADVNGNGFASLGSLELFLMSAISKHFGKGGKDKSAAIFAKYRPCYIYAYNNAKNLHSGSKKAEEDYVSFSEFRMFTLYLRIYAVMYDTFADVDGNSEGRTKDDDSRVDKDEFMKWFQSSGSGPKFKAFEGVNSEEDAEKLFSSLDTDNSGLITFSEWSDSIKKMEIEAGTELGVLLKGDFVKVKPAKKKTKKSPPSKKKAKPQWILADNPSEDISNFNNAFVAYCEKGPSGTALRKDGFRGADVNGNGLASLAELELYLKSAINKHFGKGGKDKSAALFAQYRPSYIYAYNNAKDLHSGSKKAEEDYVSFSEFRMFVVYLRIYAVMYDAFADADGFSEGRTKDDDSRVDKDEFMKWFQSSGGGPKFKVFEGVNSEEDAEKLFSSLDTDNSGLITFSEWSDSIKKMEIEAGTELGVLLKGDFVKDKPAKKKTRRAKPLGDRTNKKEKAKSMAPAKKKSNKRGIAVPSKVAESYLPSKRASADLIDFILAIQPFAEKTKDCQKLRKQTFKSIDVNSNGKCSLAAISQHVRSVLYKEHGKVRGEELFDLYRPTYIRAFTAAKTITKSDDSEDENYINYPEFRILNAYLCVYAGMGDVFFKIDGGGAGVSEDDDRRVELAEWVKAYSEFPESSFVGLRGIENDEDATTAFNEMDEDGKGMVLLSEFCDFIRTKEVDNKTPLSELLQPAAMKAARNQSM